jgi:hypothetical protein
MATRLTDNVQIMATDIFTTSLGTPQHDVGALAYTADGRKFRYVGVYPSSGGATGVPTGATLVAGNLLQASPQLTTHQNLTPSAATAVGDTTLTVTLGATAAYANQYAGGYMCVSTGPGNGYAYLIKSHPAAALSATLTLTLSDAIKVVTSTASRMDLIQNPYLGVIQNPTTATGAPVGVAVNPIAAATDGTINYGWVQSFGVCSGLVRTTTAIGGAYMPSVTTAGSMETATAGTPVVGSAIAVGTTGKNSAIFLTID